MNPFCIAGIDHIQLAAPAGCEAQARAFYGEMLGLLEIEKPELLQARGGAWFVCGAQQLHIGVESEFRPARKAHPALSVQGCDALKAKLLSAGVTVKEDDALPGIRRFYADDPFGNRLEFLESEGRI